MYLDTSYIAKFYLNEPDSPRVRELVLGAKAMRSSFWAMPEFHAVLHRHVRDKAISADDARLLSIRFAEHVSEGLWQLIPVTEALLRRTAAQLVSAPAGLFIRTADAVHLAAAQEAGEYEVWTNDRHMLAAASHFGVTGRSV